MEQHRPENTGKYEYHIAPDVGALLEEVQSGKADLGIAAISITAAREKQLDFSQPILNSGLLIMLRSQDRSGIKGQEDLPGKRVATTRGSTAADFLREIKASVYEFANIRSVYNALLDNTVDAVVFDAPVLLYYAAVTRQLDPNYRTNPSGSWHGRMCQEETCGDCSSTSSRAADWHERQKWLPFACGLAARRKAIR